MKKLVSLMVVLVFVVTSCTQVVVRAPANKRIIISSERVENPDQEKRVWYILYGLIPLGDNSTASLLKAYSDGSEVAISTEVTFLDILLTSLLGGLTIATRTIQVEQKK